METKASEMTPRLGEISYDLVMTDDMGFIEGTYRLNNASWEVVIFIKSEIDHPEHKLSSWESGVTGVVIHVPSATKLNATYVETMLSSIFHIDEWITVKGPDFMVLR